MPNRSQKPELDNEHRYAALLALTSQELPAKQGENADRDGANVNSLANKNEQALFEQLDADPEALESYLRRERARQALSQSTMRSPLQRLIEWFAEPAPRYAAAFGIVAVVAAAVILQVSRQPTWVDAIEQSYAGVQLTAEQAPVLPWEEQRAAVGFSPQTGNLSPEAIDFARGLLRGREAMSGAAPQMRVESPYVALGEWNVLLWTASQTESLPVDFWHGQAQLGRDLSAARFDDRDAAVVAAHMGKVIGMLDGLAKGEAVTRTSRNLAAELVLFRDQFAPHDPAAIVQ